MKKFVGYFPIAKGVTILKSLGSTDVEASRLTMSGQA